jgi:hypothetical protein
MREIKLSIHALARCVDYQNFVCREIVPVTTRPEKVRLCSDGNRTRDFVNA